MRVSILLSLVTVVAFVPAFTEALPGRGPPGRGPRQAWNRVDGNTWTKISPKPDGPPSPRLGYEGSWGYDPKAKVLIRWAGHNQGGGGEQNAETWTFDPRSTKWTLKEPNDAPPGVCCGQQNVFDLSSNRFLRFAAFSGSHGWQWHREIYLKNSSVWSYDLATNTWSDLRPLPEPHVAPLRCASWDSDHEVAVLFGGEGSQEGTLVYDPYTNTWTKQNTPDQPAFRSGGNMAYDSVRKLHILFGSQFTDDPHTWAYDLKANRWRDLKPSVMPPTNQNDAVLTFDSGNAMVIAIVKISEGKGDNAKSRLETWALDVHKNKWKKMNPPQEPDSSGNRARLLSFIPDLRLSILENRTHPPHGPAEQQIWMYRYRRDLVHGIPSEQPMPPTATRTQPRIVEDAVVSVRSEKAVELRWSPPAGRDVTGYHVERAAVEVWSEDQLTRLKKRTPPLAEPSVGAVRRIGAFTRLTKEPIRETSFTEQIDLTKPQAIDGKPLFERKLSKEHFDPDGKPYRFAVFAYRIRAVNALGVESGPSPYFLTIPSAPQSVFSREQGAACELKWVNNKEANVKGYRVYRMDGRFDNAAISRLTPEPVAGETFTDPQAGKATRRYYIVAVDALGQEGVPSAPVWFEREWKQFYKPFTTEWHQ